MDRRRFLTLAGGTAAGAFLGGTGLLEGVGSPARAANRRITGVALDVAHDGGTAYPYPFFSDWSDVMDQSRDLLDSLAVAYGEAVSPEHWDPADFWFRWAPLPLFAQAMDGRLAADSSGSSARQSVWIMHLVGYFGGVWFRKKLNEFTPGGGINTSTGAPPKESDFASLIAYLRRAVPAAFAPDPKVPVAFCEWALRGALSTDVPPSLGDLLSALVGLYGYNVGYTDNILRPPHRAYPPPVSPDGPSEFSPPWNSQTATPQGLFDATFPDFSATRPASPPLPPDPSGFTPVWYLTGDEPALSTARARFAAARAQVGRAGSSWDRIVSGDPARRQLPLSELQLGAYNVGNATWSVPLFLDVTHWDAPSYGQIVAMSIYFVQAVQAAGMGCLAAAAKVNPTGDNALDARDAVLAAALVQPFGGSYLVGLNAASSPAYASRTSSRSIPPFTYSG